VITTCDEAPAGVAPDATRTAIATASFVIMALRSFDWTGHPTPRVGMVPSGIHWIILAG
jgi:hypothetical protein